MGGGVVKFKTGELYELLFQDHAVGSHTPFMCKISGYIIEDNKDYVSISPWIVLTDDESVVRNNLEIFSILKCAIKKKKLINRQ